MPVNPVTMPAATGELIEREPALIIFPLMTGIALLHRWITNAQMLPAVAALALESLVHKGVLVPVRATES